MKLTNREMVRTEAEVMAEIRRSMAEMPPAHTVADVFAEVQRLTEYAYGPVESEPSTGQ